MTIPTKAERAAIKRALPLLIQQDRRGLRELPEARQEPYRARIEAAQSYLAKLNGGEA